MFLRRKNHISYVLTLGILVVFGSVNLRVFDEKIISGTVLQFGSNNSYKIVISDRDGFTKSTITSHDFVFEVPKTAFSSSLEIRVLDVRCGYTHLSESYSLGEPEAWTILMPLTVPNMDKDPCDKLRILKHWVFDLIFGFREILLALKQHEIPNTMIEAAFTILSIIAFPFGFLGVILFKCRRKRTGQRNRIVHKCIPRCVAKESDILDMLLEDPTFAPKNNLIKFVKDKKNGKDVKYLRTLTYT